METSILRSQLVINVIYLRRVKMKRKYFSLFGLFGLTLVIFVIVTGCMSGPDLAAKIVPVTENDITTWVGIWDDDTSAVIIFRSDGIYSLTGYKDNEVAFSSILGTYFISGKKLELDRGGLGRMSKWEYTLKDDRLIPNRKKGLTFGPEVALTVNGKYKFFAATPLAEARNKPINFDAGEYELVNLADTFHALEYYKQRDFNSLIEETTVILQRDPSHGYAYNLRGLAYFHLGTNDDAAIQNLEKAVELEGGDYFTYYCLGILYYNREKDYFRYTFAARYFLKMFLASNPEEADAVETARKIVYGK
jgi:tetratricopeptide (TPR) repeat protein